MFAKFESRFVVLSIVAKENPDQESIVGVSYQDLLPEINPYNEFFQNDVSNSPDNATLNQALDILSETKIYPLGSGYSIMPVHYSHMAITNDLQVIAAPKEISEGFKIKNYANELLIRVWKRNYNADNQTISYSVIAKASRQFR